MQTVDIAQAFAALGPTPAESSAVLAGQGVRLVRLRGEGSWHSHAGSDETVLAWAGREHRGVAAEGADVVLLRPV